MSMIVIYGLYDPRSNRLRYVGKTSISLEERLQQHISNAKGGMKTHKANWIRLLLSAELKPYIEILGETTEAAWQEDEKAWIAKAKKEGIKLTNLTKGGDGLIGYNHSDEAKKKIRDYNIKEGVIPPSTKGHKQSPEHIHKRVEARQKKDNYGHSDETKRKMSQNRAGKNMGNTHTLGMKHSDETRRKMSEAHRGEKNAQYGKEHSEESKRKMGEARKGKATGNQNAKGSKRTAEQKEVMSKARKGKPGKSHTEESKQKLREVNLGKKHTPEARQKMGEASRRYWAKKKAEATKR